MTVRDLLGDELGWKANCKYWTRNSFHSVRDCDHPFYCVTSGNMSVGAERVGDFTDAHNIGVRTRARLQAYDRKLL